MSDFAFEDQATEARGGREALRGAIVLVAAAAALVGVAFIIMQAVTGPDGWATRMATTAYSGEAVLVSGPIPDGMAD